MRILFIGGTRFVGYFAVEQLLASGHEVVVFHRTSCPDLPDGVREILGDRSALEDRVPEFRRFGPEVVVDMIPATEADARSAVATFRGLAARIVAISSQDVYRAYGRLQGIEAGPPDPVPLTEDAALRERLFPYRDLCPPEVSATQKRWMRDYDKILVERVILAEPELPGTVLRLPMVYGPRDAQHRLGDHLIRMDAGRPAIVLDEGLARWHWTRGYVEDVAAAIALAATDSRATGRIYNVGEPTALSMQEWVAAIGCAAGWEGRIVPVPREQLPPDLRADSNTDQDLVTDSARIRRELGYRERLPQPQALERAVAWERAQERRPVVDHGVEDRVLASLGWGCPHGRPPTHHGRSR